MQRLRLLSFSVVLVLVTVAVVGPFVIDAGSADHDPVNFDRTVEMGITMEEEMAYGDDVQLPRVQVFYSQYQYVVGYYGVETFAETQRQEGHEQRFGYPLTIYVTDYSGTDLELTGEGYPTTDAVVGWVEAEEAVFVVDSEARSAQGETVVPFSEEGDAEAFAEEYGGEVLTWEAVLERRFEIDDADVVRERLGGHHERADAFVADSRPLLERPVSVVVGEDTATIGEAVESAPENTTVLVPEGTYEETVEVDRPITLAGEDGATVDGGGNGTVITLSADRGAVTGLEVVGTGDIHHEDDRDEEPPEDDVDAEDEEWDEEVEDYYGNGDAGIAAIDVRSVLIEDVTIETRANGVLLRDSPESVVRNATVFGTEDPYDGFMGVVAMRSPGVIEESTFVGGRDGTYTHHSDGIVVRDNAARDLRYGVHLMYTSDSMVAENRVENPDIAGVTVMTTPERNAIVGNYVEGGNFGLMMLGSHTYVAENALVGNGHGFTTGASNSVYEHNVVVDNGVGTEARSVLPSNRIVANDYIGNEKHVVADEGPLRVFTQDGTGNYWEGAIGSPDPETGTLDRAYTPTDAVDSRLHYLDGTPTLARSPAISTIGGLEAAAPALREGTVVDTAPLCEPANPELLEDIGLDGDVRDCESP